MIARRSQSRRNTLVAFALLTGASCAARARAAASDLPHIDAVRPDTVVARFGAVVEVVIGGRGFAPGSPGMNALEFAGSRINAVPSNATGTEIRFVIPETIPSTSEAPPRPLMGGTYMVRIVTGAGTSNGMLVTVVR